MKNYKLILAIIYNISIFNCFGQYENYDISGTWIAIKGELISSFCHPTPSIAYEIGVGGLKFSFNKETFKINQSFGQYYQKDSMYCYTFMDTISNDHQDLCKIKIKSIDNNNIILEMPFLGYTQADRVKLYRIYLKKE